MPTHPCNIVSTPIDSIEIYRIDRYLSIYRYIVNAYPLSIYISIYTIYLNTVDRGMRVYYISISIYRYIVNAYPHPHPLAYRHIVYIEKIVYIDIHTP